MLDKMNPPASRHKLAYAMLAAVYAGYCVGIQEHVSYFLVALIYLGLALD